MCLGSSRFRTAKRRKNLEILPVYLSLSAKTHQITGNFFAYAKLLYK